MGGVGVRDSLPVWACTGCGHWLARSDTRYSCNGCGRSWPVVDGIPHFTSEAPYWGEIPENTLRWVLEQMKTRPWRDVFQGSDDPDLVRTFPFVAHLNRVNWQYLLPSGHGRTALCVGEGMGTTAHALAANYASVVALEPVLPRVEFMRQRLGQDGVTNVQIVRATFPDVPFAPGSFDLVVFNGVVEWLPSGQPWASPKDVQQAAVRKAFDLLKPGGSVFIGIENRWCYEYFLAAKDPHVGTPWVTILPRPLADWIMRRSTGRRYDAYLFGSRGYRSLLKQAGFAVSQVFIAKDSYNSPAALVPITDPIASYFFRRIDSRPERPHRRLFQTIAAALGLLPHLQYAFVVIGTKR